MPENSKGFDRFLPHGMQDHSGMFTPKKRKRPMKKMEKMGMPNNNKSDFVESGLKKSGPKAEKDPIDGTARGFTPPQTRVDIDFGSTKQRK